jgi:hypothetical protein
MRADKGRTDEELKGEDKKEAEKNNEAARLWISGLEAVNRKLELSRVIDPRHRFSYADPVMRKGRCFLGR